MNRQTRKRKGFTLMEIIVVVIIIGVLSAILIPRMADSTSNAKRSAALTEHRTLISESNILISKSAGLGKLKASELVTQLKVLFDVPAADDTGGKLSCGTTIVASNSGGEGVVTITTAIPAAGGQVAETKVYTINGLAKD